VIVTPDLDAYAATEINVCEAIDPLGIERSAPAACDAKDPDGWLKSALEAIVPLKLAIA
jgi:hypothetical protein